MGKTKTRIKNKSTRKKNSKKRVNISKKRLTRRTKSKSNKQMRAHVFTSKEELQKALNQYYDYPTEMIEKYGKINNWDVSQITDMSYLFMETNFNEDISNWNVSNVTDMSYMFYSATKFNQPIGSWDVSKVTNMQGMFAGAESFNQPLGYVDAANPGWDVSNVTTMNSMFKNVDYAESFLTGKNVFNQPLNSWNVSNVTDMSHMFHGAYDFNQPLGYVDAANPGWNVSNVTDMSHMFHGAESFNQSLDSWNVSNVTDMSHMFHDAYNFNQSLDSWNVSNVTDMSHMFEAAMRFDNFDFSWDIRGKNKNDMFLNSRLDLITSIYAMIKEYSKTYPTMMSEQFQETRLASKIKNYIEVDGKIGTILKYVLSNPSFSKTPLFRRELLTYLIDVHLLDNNDKNVLFDGARLIDWYMAIPIKTRYDDNKYIYNQLKPDEFQSESPESYEETGNDIKLKPKTRVRPDYEIIIFMHGTLNPKTHTNMSILPFRNIKHLVRKGFIMQTAHTFTVDNVCNGIVDTYTHTKDETYKMIEKMHLSIDLKDKHDASLGIFICDKNNYEITKLLSVEDNQFVFVENSNFNSDNLPRGFSIDDQKLKCTLMNAISFIMDVLNNYPRQILGKKHVDFKKCDLVIAACRGINGSTNEVIQRVRHTPRARRYVNENDLMLESVNEENTLPDDFF